MVLFNKTVLMSDALNFRVDDFINPYYGDPTVDTERAENEHKLIQKLLTEAGVKIISVASPTTSQDGVYTANWGLVRGDTVVLSSLPQVRKSEESYAENILSGLGKKVVHVPNGLKFSGQGDTLPCGNYLFAGSGYRSDEAAQEFVARSLGYELIQLRTIPELGPDGLPMNNAVSGWPDSFFYDIDLALAVIKPPVGSEKGLIAYCPEALTPASQKIMSNFTAVDKIIVSIDEARNAFATNLVSTGETVVMTSKAPKLKQELESRGLSVLTADITELAKGGGFIRCTTLTLD
jgi:N-dimethylarginine dimethylaminohydrolase